MWEPGESARLPARPVVVMLWFMATAEEALTARLHVELPSPQARRELLGAPRRWQLGPSVQLRVPQLELRLTGSRQKAGNCSYAPSSIMNICQHDLIGWTQRGTIFEQAASSKLPQWVFGARTLHTWF